MQRLLVLTLLLMVATPAQAGGGTPVSAPSSLALFALGVVGVFVGRYAAHRRPPHDRADDGPDEGSDGSDVEN